MVNSADEPPLLNRLHSWAKNKISLSLNPFRKSKQDAPTDSAGTLPQYAGHISQCPGQSATTPENSIHRQDTGQQSSSTVDTQGAREESTTIAENEEKASTISRFTRDVKRIICSSWVNWLLLVVPPAIIIGAIEDWGHHHVINPSVVFALNAIAIIPLASLLAFATESVAIRLGDTIGALLNVTFGNAVEIIVFVIALIAGEVRIVQAAVVGSILSNLLLILGMAFVLGGLRFREQLYNPSVGQMSACLLCLSVLSLLLPTAFHAAFSNQELADHVVLKVSRGTSVVLLLVYCLYLVFQLKSHAFMYQSTPQHIIDEESHPGVLAEMLNSSSSEDSSSSSDSDSSQTTAKRIKRALRRKRRKSSTSGDASSPTLPRVQLADGISSNPDGALSGDEADGESKRDRQNFGQAAVRARDFDNGESATTEKRKSRKTLKKSKHTKVNELDEKAGNIMFEESEASRYRPQMETNKISDRLPKAVNSNSTRPHVETNTVSENQNESAERSPRRPFHLRELSRELSTTIRPAFNSTVFPHHEATGRSLVVPGIRLESPRPPISGIRRTSSMPDINRHRSPARQPILNISPVQQSPTAEIQIEDVWDPKQHLSKTSSVILLLCSTGLVALCAEFLVGSIDYMVKNSGVSQAFIGLIILPIVGNAAEHVTAITVAYKNKMDLAINIALGSSIQIALFVTPLMVMLGWAIGADMSLYFSLFETMSLFASAFIVNYLMIDGRSNYLEGCLLIAAYVIIAIAAFFYPQCDGTTMLC